MVYTEFLGEKQGLFKDFFFLYFDIEWHKVKIFQIRTWKGFTYCNTFPQEGTVPRVLQITENELCREHWNHEKTHFHDQQENLRTAVLSSFPLGKTLF